MGKNEDLLFFYNPESSLNVPPIFAIHGMWATWQRWKNYAEFFATRGWPFFAVTLRHHFPGNECLSKLGKVGVEEYARDVSELIKTLTEGKYLRRRPIIFGHSMGGLIALKLAEEGLASGLVLLNSAPPAGIPLRPTLRYQLAIARYLPQLLLWLPFKPSLKIASYFIMNGVPKEKRPLFYQKMVAESGRAAWEIRKGKVRVNFERITCPTLVIGCERDRIVSPIIAVDIYKNLSLSNPRCKLALLPAAHWVQIEGGWKWSALLINKWLRRELRNF